MDRPYESIPRQGRHAGHIDEEPSSSVRAEPAPYPPEHDPAAHAPAYHLAYNAAESSYRIQAGATATPGAGYEPRGTFDRLDAVATQLPEYARFFVFENPETGEVYYDRQGNLTGSVPGAGYTRITAFRDEIAAAAYADARQRGDGKG